MGEKIKRKFNDKREGMVYVVIFLWIFMGILSGLNGVDLEQTAVYYVSLTGFVGSYVWAESVRKSKHESIIFRGKSSGREIVMYLTILLWTIMGVWGIIYGADMLSISAYFASLNPFVSAYILGQTYKPSDPASLRPKIANDPRNQGYGGTGGVRPNAHNTEYNKDEDVHVQEALENKKQNPDAEDPDIQVFDTST